MPTSWKPYDVGSKGKRFLQELFNHKSLKECWKFKESIQETKSLKKLIKKIKETNLRMNELSKGSKKSKKIE